MNHYLAVDIGASSGRHILGYIQNGKIITEEIHRFENGLREKNGHLCWDTDMLFREILNGMKKAGNMGKAPYSMGIDTWGVDFVLLDGNGSILGDTVGYRDKRTENAEALVHKYFTPGALYRKTGINRQSFNTIFQLAAIKKENPNLLDLAEKMLMYPDYFNYLLTGNTVQEYTNATTTGLVNAESGEWDYEIIEGLGFPRKIFQNIKAAGTKIGGLMPDIVKKVGYNTRVILPASHDTGSAVAAVPNIKNKSLFISSGTWSLMGIEREKANLATEGMKRGFSNEGGYGKRFRYLKNIMGLWMIQNIRRENGNRYSFAQLCEMAEQSDIMSTVDCTDSGFLAPKSMTEAVKEFCAKSGQAVPKSVGDTARIIYRSLAKCCGETAGEIETLTGKSFDTINIIGGGSKADYLNRLISKETGKRVLAGPAEATAVGNLIVQMISDKVFSSLEEARECVNDSFEIKEYLP